MFGESVRKQLSDEWNVGVEQLPKSWVEFNERDRDSEEVDFSDIKEFVKRPPGNAL